VRVLGEPFTALRALPDDPGRWQVGLRGATGLPLFLLPGIEGDGRCFVALAALGDRRPTFAFDLPSSSDGGLPALAAGLLSRIRAPRFAVFGLSFGGLVARAMAERAPERVAGLVTLGTLPARRHLPLAVERQAQRLAWVPEAVFRVAYRRRIAHRMTEEGVASVWREPLLDDLPSRDTLRGRLWAIRGWALGPPPPVPTLWLRGQLDREAPGTVADAQRDLPLAGAETVQGGHRAQLTHPAPLRELIEHFLRTVR
jgi:pimeloyl-ACP methyl ester carboxylesterase